MEHRRPYLIATQDRVPAPPPAIRDAFVRAFDPVHVFSGDTIAVTEDAGHRRRAERIYRLLGVTCHSREGCGPEQRHLALEDKAFTVGWFSTHRSCNTRRLTWGGTEVGVFYSESVKLSDLKLLLPPPGFASYLDYFVRVYCQAGHSLIDTLLTTHHGAPWRTA
jgi:hypothetical protein